jgi:hypothetical protein
MDPRRLIRTGAVVSMDPRRATLFNVRVVFSSAALTPSHFLFRTDSSRDCLISNTSKVAATISTMEYPLDKRLHEQKTNNKNLIVSFVWWCDIGATAQKQLQPNHAFFRFVGTYILARSETESRRPCLARRRL